MTSLSVFLITLIILSRVRSNQGCISFQLVSAASENKPKEWSEIPIEATEKQYKWQIKNAQTLSENLRSNDLTNFSLRKEQSLSENLCPTEWRIHFLLNIDHIISVAKYINNRLAAEHHVYLMDHSRQREQAQLETVISKSIFQTSTVLFIFSSSFFN